MITWRGRGYIVPLLALLAVGAPLEFEEYWLMYLMQGAAFIVAGAICWFLGSRWNKGQDYYSQAAGKFHWKDIFEVGLPEDTSVYAPELSPSHSFTLIKVQYYGIIFPVVALILIVIGLMKM